MLILVRDDTVLGEKGTYQNGEQTINYDYTSYFQKSNNFYGNSDGIEVRFYFGTDLTVGEARDYKDTVPVYPFTHTYGTLKDNKHLRSIGTTREGNFFSCDPEPLGAVDGKEDVFMTDYVSVVDLAPEDSTRKTLKLFDTAGNENGYMVGIEFRIEDYQLAIGNTWDETASADLLYCVTVMDQLKPVRELDGEWVLATDPDWLYRP